ncbi:MAG: MATE family efflux transporter [Gammaproteobacteria bacterium]|nr:MATE family efflux transporter [Gammaproteobacteria bacterium]
MTAKIQRNEIIAESRALIALGLPLIVNNVITGLNTFIDFIMTGKIGAADLAGVGVGNTIWAFVFLAGMGILMALNPITAQLDGAGEDRQIGETGRQSLWLGFFIATGIFLFLRHGADNVMRVIGIQAELIPIAHGYLRALSFGTFAIYAFLGLRYISEGIGHTKPIMFIALAGLCVNALGNYVLMFGNFGAPALGTVGCGYATAIAMWCTFLGMLLYFVKTGKIYARINLFERFEWPHPVRLREILGVGLPISGSVSAEVGLFSAAGLIMGTLGANEAAAHSVAINYASTMFMVPLALHSAIMIRVGQAVGAENLRRARFTGWVGIAICSIFMAFSALVLLLFRGPITTLYVDDEAVRIIAAQLLTMAVVFQIADGMQVGAAGAVRGFKDTRVPFYINVFSYWVIGFPVAWYFGTQLDWRGQGVWGGLAAGLTVSAALLCWRFRSISHAHR